MYGEEMPVEQLVQSLSDLKQGYTQYGGAHFVSCVCVCVFVRVNGVGRVMARLGLRPFGVSLLYAGYDRHYGFQLYAGDPSGNYAGWKAVCIGANHGSATSILKQEYNEEMTLAEAVEFVFKALSKVMDTVALSGEKCMP